MQKIQQNSLEEVFNLYLSRGNEEYHGEPVSQLEHALQAATLAKGQGYEEEVVLAAFLHDIGHLLSGEHTTTMEEWGVMSHEQLGAHYLRELGFSDYIAELVGQHVQAKRYLTATKPGYMHQLSEASKATLRFQGGPMSPEEVAAFEANPLKPLILRMRQWDDAAKLSHANTLFLYEIWEMADRHLNGKQQAIQKS